jgi:type VI protein secretion system component VasK
MVVGLAGCSSGGQPAMCDSADALRQSVNGLTNINLSENGMMALRAAISEVKSDLNQLVADAKAQFQQQTDQLKAAVSQLSTSVSTALADPTAATLGAVGTAVDALKVAFADLRSALSDAC